MPAPKYSIEVGGRLSALVPHGNGRDRAAVALLESILADSPGDPSHPYHGRVVRLLKDGVPIRTFYPTGQRNPEMANTMTRKHFVEMASLLKGLRPDRGNKFSSRKERQGGSGAYEQWRQTVRAFACDFCPGMNAQFDRERFLKACGYHNDEPAPVAEPAV